MTRSTSPFVVAALSLLLPVLSGCNVDLVGGGGSNCTLIGCVHSVTIQFEKPLGVNTSLTVIATDGSGLIRTISCKTPSDCDDEIVLEDFAPATFDIEVSPLDEETRRFSYEPTYEINRPNGPDCPPLCVFTEVTLTA